MNDAGRIGFVIRGDYDNGEIYEFLDVVYYNKSSYVAKKTTTGNYPEKENEYWQILAEGVETGSTVTGVKGENEEEYRTGDVNITKENIGLGNVSNTSPSNSVINFSESTERENINSGEEASALFGKIKKWFSDLKTVAFSGSYSDLTNKPGLNTKNNNGFVEKGEGNENKVWGTDEEGNPGWMENKGEIEMLETEEEVEANTEVGFAVDALVIKSINNNLENDISEINSNLNICKTKIISGTELNSIAGGIYFGDGGVWVVYNAYFVHTSIRLYFSRIFNAGAVYAFGLPSETPWSNLYAERIATTQNGARLYITIQGDTNVFNITPITQIDVGDTIREDFFFFRR